MADLLFNARHGLSVGNAAKTGAVNILDTTGNATVPTITSPYVYGQFGTGGTITIKANSTDATGTVAVGSNTSVTGTLGVSSTFTVNTDKFSVNATNGNVTAAGTVAANTLTATNPLAITYGGTGGTSTAQALTNLLPSGTGYLKTTGAGTYYWDAGTGSVPEGTRINSSRTFATATASQTVFTAPTYTVGASQLRVYINGVRQFNSEYTETSTTSVTLGTGCTAGDLVMCEVDGYYSYAISASGVTFTPVGNLSSTDVQAALGELDTEKAPVGQTFYLGTTQVAINRTSGALSLTGITAIDGSAAKWTTVRSLAGNGVDGSADVAFSNKFIVQGTSDTGLSGAQFMGSLGTGLVKNTTTTGVFSIATAGSDYAAPNQTFYLGTTQVAINRSSAEIALTGITSIDGTAAKATNLVGTAWTVPYQSGTDTTSTVSLGAAGTVLASNGATSAPSWQTIAALGAATLGDAMAMAIALS